MSVQEMSPSERVLQGMALHTNMKQEKFIRHFPAKRLSKDPATRFSQLFAAKSQWLLPELEPFLWGIQVCSFLTSLPEP